MNPDKKSETVSFTITPSLKKEIEELMQDTDFVNRSEFLRVCVSINRSLIKHAKEGLTELVVQTPGAEKRKYILLSHLLKVKKNE